MKINYTIDSEYINSYTIFPFNEKLPSLEVSEADLQYLQTGKCKLNNRGKLDKSEAIAYVESLHEKSLLNSELSELSAWFHHYDEQSIKYARQMRIYGESAIDIAALDAQAEKNAARIKEIKALLK